MKKILALLLTGILLTAALCGCDLLSPLKSLLPGAGDSDPTGAQNAVVPLDTAAPEVTLNLFTATVKAGESVQLELIGADGTAQWQSSDDKVAVVNSQGLVTGVSAGVANITCTTADTQLACTVTVTGTAQSPTPGDSDFIFPHSSSAYLTDSEISQTLAGMTGPSPGKSYAQDAVNEIYARHGYPFQTAEVRAYYESKPWYTPNPNFSQSDLNKYEQYNIQLLQKY